MLTFLTQAPYWEWPGPSKGEISKEEFEQKRAVIARK